MLNTFADRDVSWLSFNKRVLSEAERHTLPLMERLKFLAIYSANLDEFYRVRVPALMALEKLSEKNKANSSPDLLSQINTIIYQQQELFGQIMTKHILPGLKKNNINFLYGEPLPAPVRTAAQNYFFHEVAAFLQIINVSDRAQFFPENNKIYLAVAVRTEKGNEKWYTLNIPSDSLPRFYSITAEGLQHIVFLDDIIKINLPAIFKDQEIISCYSFKVTRDAELDLEDEFEGNLARKIEKKISQRDFGLATRFLYEPGISTPAREWLQNRIGLKKANAIQGGRYHNLKDLATLPVKDSAHYFEPWPRTCYIHKRESLFEDIKSRDILLHTPYHSFDTILRFFNEAAIDVRVTTIYVTLYRVANDSRIVNALINAAINGKKVIVFVELKARFDEANNIKWSKKLKAAGVRIIQSIPALKVHAKLAVVKYVHNKKNHYLGLLSTGNFNENTAKHYTDHILLTASQPMLKEMEKLFLFLKQRTKPSVATRTTFKHLLVGQFNLLQTFLDCIEREIALAHQGLPAAITIKLNNLEEKTLMAKLYDASRAGVKVSLLVRGICCLVPGVQGMSENIVVKRIVDRYLEHGRIFVFHNNGTPDVFLGSADWMNRNIYRRIEVCFPLQDAALRSEVIALLDLQWRDNAQAVLLDEQMNNVPITDTVGHTISSQKAISELILSRATTL